MTTRLFASAIAITSGGVSCALASACFLTASLDGLAHSSGQGNTDGAGGDGGTGWCASQGHHDLCDDFDEDSGMWGPPEIIGGSLSLDSDASVSPPNSLLSAVAGRVALQTADLEKTFPGNVTQVTCRFALRLDHLGGDTQVAQLVLAGTTADLQLYNLSVHYGPDGGTFVEFARGIDGGVLIGVLTPIDPPQGGTWINTVLFTATIAGDSGTATMSYDGTQVLSAVLSPPPTRASATWKMGISFASPAAASVHYDNVACDVVFGP
jgi:hypothetical protein